MAFERTDRRFDIAAYGVEVIETEQYPLIRRLASDPSSIVVSIHGACRPVGQMGARGGYGAFFGTDSTLNRSGRLKVMSRQTSQYAELSACITAMETIRNLHLEGEGVRHVVFRSSSENLWLGLTQRVWDWQLRGWRKRTGKPVANFKAWRNLHRKLSLVEAHGVKFGVCLVDRALNESAATLSKAVLGGEKPQGLAVKDRRTSRTLKKMKARKALRGRISNLPAPSAGVGTLEDKATGIKVPLEERITRVKDEEMNETATTSSSATLAQTATAELYYW